MADLTQEELEALNREELNEVAEEAGVDSPEDLPNKQAVIEAINKEVGVDEADEGEADEEEAPTTSNAASHVEGVAIGDVKPDPQEGSHSSDSPDYPFPQGGDVDVASLSDEEIDGETLAPIPPDARVILADTDAVPEELQGHPALITNASVEEDEDGEEQQVFTVKTRDEHDATLAGLTRDDFAEVHPGGVGVRGFGP